MKHRRLRVVAAAFALLALGGCATSNGPGIAGTPPTYASGDVADPPNAAAIATRIWVPELDQFLDPQGLAVAGGDVLVSGFASQDHSLAKGQCHVYRIDTTTGALRGSFALPFTPPPGYDESKWCGHAGGIAAGGDGTLFVADTRLLFVMGLDAFDQPTPAFRMLHLQDAPERRFVGGVAAAGPGSVWIGASVTDGPARLYRFDMAKVQGLADGATLSPDMASASVPLPTYAQGAAVDRDGSLWIMRSDLGWAELEHLDGATGALIARYDLPAASEGIAFDARGRLWAVSEAGARRFYDYWPARLWYPFYPLVYAIDVAKLRG